MQLIYIHGFNSDHNSIKGQWLDQYCQQHRPHIRVQRPDLNCSPNQVMQRLGELIALDSESALVGSSLGGYFATACVAKYGLRAVLINPVVRPFDRFFRYFEAGDTPDHVGYVTEGGWALKLSHLDELKALFNPVPVHPERMLVLLKEGDEVLDYRDAAQHYGQGEQQSPMLIEAGGDHFMYDMQDKIPLMLDFLWPRPSVAVQSVRSDDVSI